MTKISFSKKHISVAVFLGLAIIGLFLLIWGTLIQPKATKVRELKKQLTSLNVEINTVQEKADILQELPALFETPLVTDKPKIPNGTALTEYFQGLAKQQENIAIKHITFEDKAFFPPVEEGILETSENQIRSLLLSIDTVGRTEPDLLKFIADLENGDRFAKVTQLDYRHNPDFAGDDFSIYAATINLKMYYLSSYETGKPIINANDKQQK